MVNIWEMRMRVLHDLMLVFMAVRRITIPRKVMAVLVMRIVAVLVRVRHRSVLMRMVVVLGQVQPDPGRHEHCRQPEHHARRFTQHGDGQRSAHKRRARKVGPGAGRTQATQGQYKQHQAQAVAEKSDHHGRRDQGQAG